MQIDAFAPQYDFVERHRIQIDAPVKRVYAAVRSLDLSDSAIMRTLFGLRGMPTECLKLDGLLKRGFILLDEVPDKELVLGVTGRFWSLSGELQSLDAEGFRSFNQHGYLQSSGTSSSRMNPRLK